MFKQHLWLNARLSQRHIVLKQIEQRSKCQTLQVLMGRCYLLGPLNWKWLQERLQLKEAFSFLPLIVRLLPDKSISPFSFLFCAAGSRKQTIVYRMNSRFFFNLEGCTHPSTVMDITHPSESQLKHDQTANEAWYLVGLRTDVRLTFTSQDTTKAFMLGLLMLELQPTKTSPSGSLTELL